MKRLIISVLLISLSVLNVKADVFEMADEDSVTISDYNYERFLSYERRVVKRQERWNALLPDYMRVQYAGSIGLVNIGAGWEYGKNKRWETDVMVGLVPRYQKDEAFGTFTLRETYVPWKLSPLLGRSKYISENFTVQPLSFGMFVNTVMRSDYWTREPERYPRRSYYRFSSKLRCHIFVGQRYCFHIPEKYRWLSKELSLVWELSSCDMYIISKATNRSILFSDILSMSIGLKMNI